MGTLDLLELHLKLSNPDILEEEKEEKRYQIV
jgi:hypothetical protein